MIVVSDTSPVLNLAAVGQLSVLNQLYGDILIPPIVAQELIRNGFDPKAGWIKVEAPKDASAVRALLEVLDAGEAEAIVLAEERSAGLLLIDERRGWRIAVKKGIPSTGLLGVLAEAKKKGLIEMCGPILDDMTRLAGFWVGQDLRSRYLQSIGE